MQNEAGGVPLRFNVRVPATVFHVLGIPQTLHCNDQSGRPVPMVYGGTPVSVLVS